jgi:ATP-dependent RNA helicase DeaD
MATARIKAEWAPPPSADAIRTRDGERLVAEAATAAETAGAEPEALALGKALLEKHGAEAVAAALLRALGAKLPAPEDLDPPEPAPRAPREPRPGQQGGGEGVWFRLSVGRNRNADPRWLLPFLCRRGHVTRQEIGRISVLDRETRVEIAPWAAERFAAAASRPDADDEDIAIALVRPEGGERPARPPAGGRPVRRPSGPAPVRHRTPRGRPG